MRVPGFSGVTHPGPGEIGVAEETIGVEPVSERREVVEARIALAQTAASCVCILPQCGRPPWASMTSSTAAKYAVGSVLQ
jgi:hypothetical protein